MLEQRVEEILVRWSGGSCLQRVIKTAALCVDVCAV